MVLFGGAIGDLGDTQLMEEVRLEGQWQGLVCCGVKTHVGRRQHVRILEEIDSCTKLSIVGRSQTFSCKLAPSID